MHLHPDDENVRMPVCPKYIAVFVHRFTSSFLLYKLWNVLVHNIINVTEVINGHHHYR